MAEIEIEEPWYKKLDGSIHGWFELPIRFVATKYFQTLKVMYFRMAEVHDGLNSPTQIKVDLKSLYDQLNEDLRVIGLLDFGDRVTSIINLVLPLKTDDIIIRSIAEPRITGTRSHEILIEQAKRFQKEIKLRFGEELSFNPLELLKLMDGIFERRVIWYPPYSVVDGIASAYMKAGKHIMLLQKEWSAVINYLDRRQDELDQILDAIKSANGSTGNPEAASPKKPLLRVVSSNSFSEIILRDNHHAVDFEVAQFFNELIRAKGRPINATDMFGKVTRLKAKLHPDLQALIESAPGKGTMIPAEKLLELNLL